MRMVSAAEHYDLLINEDHDPMLDPPQLQRYMRNWDGPAFWEALKPKGKYILEAGVGTGRLARQVLDAGCSGLTGVDVSARSIAKAQAHLRNEGRVELVHGDITAFARPASFDAAYSVLTFFHIEDKAAALRNIFLSLKPGGVFVLSTGGVEGRLDYGSRAVRLYPASAEDYMRAFVAAGFEIESLRPLGAEYGNIITGRREASLEAFLASGST